MERLRTIPMYTTNVLIRWFVLVMLGVAVIFPGAGSASVNAMPTASLPTVSSGDDFATQEMGNPWDMSDSEDIAFEFTRDTGKVSSITFAGGVLKAVATAPPRVTLLMPSNSTINPVPSEGGYTPINANEYRYLTVRFYVGSSNGSNAARFTWQATSGATPGGSPLFYVPTAGWYIATYDLTQPGPDAGAPAPWSGLIQGLYFDPMLVTGGPFEIDFVRLSKNFPAIPLTWSNLNGTIDIYVGTAANGSDKAKIAGGVSAGRGRYDWRASLSPGLYYVFLQAAGTGNVLQTLTLPVNATPQLRITAPSYISGPDYATEQLGNPWDMSDPADVTATKALNSNSFSFANGIFSATSVQQNDTCQIATGAVPCGDAQVTLNVGPPIDTNRYKYFTYRMKLDGEQDTTLGSIARLIWWVTRPQEATITRSWVVYEGWQTVSFDLTRIKLRSNSMPAWTESKPTTFRFDPHELAAPRTMQLDYVALTGENQADASFAIRYLVNDADSDRLTTRFFYDTDAQGFNGQPITCSSAASAPGQNGKFNIFLPLLERVKAGPVAITGEFCTWQTANVPPGSYYIYGTASDGLDTFREYSQTPVIISH